MKGKILLMGPVSPPYTGQSVAFTSIVDFYKKQDQNNIILVNLSNKGNALLGLLLVFEISAKIIFNKIDVIYFTCSRSFLGSIRDIILLGWARVFNIKVINHLHGADFLNFYENADSVYKRILMWGYNIVDTSIVLTAAMKEQFKNFDTMLIKVIPNSYFSLLDAYPQTKIVEEKYISLLYLSNIIETKGIILLLESFEKLVSTYSDIVLNIAGLPMGDEVSSKSVIMEKFMAKYRTMKEKYPDNIYYLGSISGKEKADLLCKSDIFVLPTFYKTEAFPISILEALRAGNYIISTNHNYIPEIINEDNGELIQPNSTDSLYDSIEKIINNRKRLNKVQNYNIEYAIKNYSEDKYIHSVTQIINENLSDNSNV